MGIHHPMSNVGLCCFDHEMNQKKFKGVHTGQPYTMLTLAVEVNFHLIEIQKFQFQAKTSGNAWKGVDLPSGNLEFFIWGLEGYIDQHYVDLKSNFQYSGAGLKLRFQLY